MAKRVRLSVLSLLFFSLLQSLHAADARFDLTGPSIDVRVTRNGVTLPIASVPNLQAGDRIWLHTDLPASQSVHYLLICAFLRGTTNPPPDSWFIRIETWDKKVREEGTFITVPAEAQQAVLFMAPETGGDFSTLRSAVQGRPGVFVRSSQDLAEAGFEQARIEKYLTAIRRVPPGDPTALQKHSDLLARTLALKPNPDCFKQSVDTQFTCLTQTGTQLLLDDGHGQSIVSALSNGPGSDFITAASYTNLAAGGLYSAYVGAIVDLVRLTTSLHTAQYQYIPAIAFPQAEALNLRLNAPPSFHNPKSVLVIGLPSIQKAVPPPLRPADAKAVTCLLKPTVALPIEGAPLVFSTSFAHDMVLHLNTPPGAPTQPDIPLIPDAYQGGLVLQQTPEHHVELPEPKQLPEPEAKNFAHPELDPKKPEAPAPKPEPKPILLTGTIQGQWGFDAFTGPTLQLQQLPGGDWHTINLPGADSTAPLDPTSNLIAGHLEELTITSTGSACVHTITARPTGSSADLAISFDPDPQPEHANLLKLTLPLEHAVTPGDLHIAIQQYGQPKADDLSARTFAEPAHITGAEIHAADRTIVLDGTNLAEVEKLSLGDLVFTPVPSTDADSPNELRLALPANAPAPPTHLNDHLTASISLRDGRTLSLPVVVSLARPVLTILSKNIQPAPGQIVSLPDANDLPLSQRLTFTLKSATPFPRDGQVEIETLDGTLRTVLTLAPSGGLLLQDPHTIVATLDPLRSFGPSAFGPLHLRAVYPIPPNSHDRHNREPEHEATTPEHPAATPATEPEPPTSDWLPLATLVRLPDLTLLQCPTDTTQICTLTGSSLFLIQSISTDPTFSNSIPVPDGFTGTTLSLPQPSAATIFLHLRDDPGPIDPAIIPTPPTPTRTHIARSKPITKPLPPATVIPIPAPDITTPTPSTATTKPE
jgi:hypothetical protein